MKNFGTVNLNNFNGLNHFKRDKNGNPIFFPWGPFGKGRVLTESRGVGIRGFMLRLFPFLLTVTLLVSANVVNQDMLFANLGFALWLLLPIYVACAYLTTKLLISNCVYSDETLTFNEGFMIPAAGRTEPVFWIFIIEFIAAVWFVVMLITWMLFSASSVNDILLGCFGILFSGCAGAVIGCLLYINYFSSDLASPGVSAASRLPRLTPGKVFAAVFAFYLFLFLVTALSYIIEIISIYVDKICCT